MLRFALFNSLYIKKTIITISIFDKIHFFFEPEELADFLNQNFVNFRRAKRYSVLYIILFDPDGGHKFGQLTLSMSMMKRGQKKGGGDAYLPPCW